MNKNTIYLFFILSFFSCKKDFQRIDMTGNYYVNNNFVKYEKVYNQLNDSLNYWIEQQISSVEYFQNKSEFMVDSMILFNKDSTHLYTLILKKDMHKKDAVFDYLKAIGGAKINKAWYFFFMNVTYPVDRKSFQDSIYAPLSFDELSYLAHENLIGIIRKDANNYFYVDEKFFQHNFYDLVTECPKDKWQKICVDSLILKMTSDKYKYKIKPEEIEEMKKQMARSVRPLEPKQDISLWQKLFGRKEEKLFESKEWKEYLQKKYGKDVK